MTEDDRSVANGASGPATTPVSPAPALPTSPAGPWAPGPWPPAGPWTPPAGPWSPGPWPSVPGSVAYSVPAWPPGPAPGVRWASISQRLGALALDVAVAFGILIVYSILLVALGTQTISGEELETPTGDVIRWLWLLVMFLYHPVCWWRFGATPGQRAVGIRVVRELDGRPLRLSAVALRYGIWFSLTVTVIPGIVAGLAAASEPRKRAWHDETSGSVVIKPLG